MTSTYDHRVIQGAESGAFLRRIDQLLQGEDGFYDGRLRGAAASTASAGAATAAPAAGHGRRAGARRGHARGRAAAPDEALLQAVQAATSVVKAHRMHGHLAARLDPLGSEPRGDPALDPETVNLTAELMARIPASVLRVAVPGETFAEALPHLRETYCGTIAYEIEHISDHKQRVWLRQAIESGELPPAARRRRRSAACWSGCREVEALESYLHKAFLGKKQFSIEGLDALVPMLDETIELAADGGAREVVLGHGPPRPAERAGPHRRAALRVDPRRVRGRADAVEADTAAPEGGTGDVKYHYGASGTYTTHAGRERDGHAVAQPEPPRVREPGDRGPRPRRPDEPQGPRARPTTRASCVPVLIHGDAAFPGQGVVAETLNLQALDGLLHRRHDPHHRQQPARLHHRPATRPLHALRVGPRQGLRHPDHPRQRRRRGGLHRAPSGWRMAFRESSAATR